MKVKIFFTIVLLFSISKLYSQNNKVKVLLIQLFSDSSFNVLDTSYHRMSLYSVSKKRKIKCKENNLFLFKNEKGIKKFVLNVDDKLFNFQFIPYVLKNKFIVIHLYLSPSGENKATKITVVNGDLIYKINECIGKCNYAEIIFPKILVGPKGSPTTGYEILDNYLFK